MKRIQRSVSTATACALLGAAALLAACGGGGSASAPRAVPTAATTSNAAATAGKASLSIKFPPGFKTARAAKSSTRQTRYVNPLNNNLLDVYVDGTLQLNLDGGTPSHSATVLPGGDGTQTLPIALLSNHTNDVVVIEWDNTDASILAIGESPSTTFQPGDSPVVALSMQMNVANVVFDTVPSGGSPQLVQGQTATVGNVCFPNVPNATSGGMEFVLYVADAVGGFVPTDGNEGYGGTVAPVIRSASPDPVQSALPTLPATTYIKYNGHYAMSYSTANGGGATLAVGIPNNPAQDLYYASAGVQNLPVNFNGGHLYDAQSLINGSVNLDINPNNGC